MTFALGDNFDAPVKIHAGIKLLKEIEG